MRSHVFSNLECANTLKPISFVKVRPFPFGITSIHRVETYCVQGMFGTDMLDFEGRPASSPFVSTISRGFGVHAECYNI